MSLTPTVPPFLPSVLGQNADVRDIPEENSTPTGQLNYKSGYPPETALPPQAGGIAPMREDFNAVNKLFSQHMVYQQAGGTYPWQQTLDYIKGCHVLGSDGNEYVATAWSGPGSIAGIRNPTDQDVSKNYWKTDIYQQIEDAYNYVYQLYEQAGGGDDSSDIVVSWESTALMHNNIYRGTNLLSDGHFDSIADIMSMVRAGNFDDIYVGDYIPATITVNGITYTDVKFRVAAINLLNARGGLYGTAEPNLCIIPDATIGSARMNQTNVTTGGYVGSNMYKNILPDYYDAIGGNEDAPFYGFLQATTEQLSNNVSSSAAVAGYAGWTGAASGLTACTNQYLTLLSEVEVFGHNQWSSSAFNGATIAVQIPMFRLNPNTITDSGVSDWWLRDVVTSSYFAYVDVNLRSGYAAAAHAIRPRFFLA